LQPGSKERKGKRTVLRRRPKAAAVKPLLIPSHLLLAGEEKARERMRALAAKGERKRRGPGGELRAEQ
jgi:hypothetical protein